MNNQIKPQQAPAKSEMSLWKKIGVALLGLLLLPIVIPGAIIWYVWKKTSLHKPFKIAITVGVILLSLFVYSKADKTSVQSPASDDAQMSTAKRAKEEAKQKENAQKEGHKQQLIDAQAHNIVVTSQVVKKVDGKYRYFFDIRNKDMKPFNGAVYIRLYNLQNQGGIYDTFETTKGIEPNLGTSVYLDANTAPNPLHGEYSISNFKYEVKVEGVTVTSGDGVISLNFESLE